MEKIAGVLFDLDGTLIDTYEIILTSMRYAVKKVLEKDLSDKELMSMVGTPLLDQMTSFAGGDERLADELCRVYRAHNDTIHDDMVSAFPGTKEMLERLKSCGMKLGVVTSKRRKMAVQGLRVCGLEDLFELVIASDDWPEHKPKPGPVLEGCRRLGLDPSAVAYVGDSPFDILAGNAAGCLTVAVLWGVFDADRLNACNPDRCFARVGDLPTAFAG